MQLLRLYVHPQANPLLTLSTGNAGFYDCDGNRRNGCESATPCCLHDVQCNGLLPEVELAQCVETECRIKTV